MVQIGADVGSVWWSEMELFCCLLVIRIGALLDGLMWSNRELQGPNGARIQWWGTFCGGAQFILVGRLSSSYCDLLSS